MIIVTAWVDVCDFAFRLFAQWCYFALRPHGRKLNVCHLMNNRKCIVQPKIEQH